MSRSDLEYFLLNDERFYEATIQICVVYLRIVLIVIRHVQSISRFFNSFFSSMLSLWAIRHNFVKSSFSQWSIYFKKKIQNIIFSLGTCLIVITPSIEFIYFDFESLKEKLRNSKAIFSKGSSFEICSIWTEFICIFSLNSTWISRVSARVSRSLNESKIKRTWNRQKKSK